MLENSVLLETSVNRHYVYILDESIDDIPISTTISENKPPVDVNINNINNSAYFSINSNSIVGSYFSKCNDNDLPNQELINSELDNRKISNIFLKKNFVFLHFEVIQFVFNSREYFLNLYPELNLIMIIEINDSKLTQEKITFIRSKEDKKDMKNYFPLRKKEDNKANCYRFIQAFEVSENDLEMPFKINISFFTFTNHKLISICNDEIYLKLNKEGEVVKYKLHRNMHMKHSNDKMGSYFFNFCYKFEELYPMDLENEKMKILYKLNVRKIGNCIKIIKI